jgi:ribosomal protein S18 acetylase RimI-like enzyme
MLLRPAQPADAMAVARVHVRSWQSGYRGLLPDQFLDALKPEDRARRYTFGSSDPKVPATILASDAGVICGFATTGPARDTDVPDYGELWALYVDPDYWGRGIGAALTSAARAQLMACGFPGAVLWVLADNARAERFYRLDGWTPDGMRKTDTSRGVTLEEVRYRRALP